MHKLSLTAATLCLVAQLATAQIKLPSPSPGASVMQTIGTTDITVTYSRPSLKGRQPFTDSFVPLGKVWRTGANSPTMLTTSTDLMVGGKKLAAGSYAVLSIPQDGNATLIFSKNKETTEATYKQEEDALRVNLTPAELPEKVETFTIGFSDLTDSTAKLNFMWANVKASADLRVDVNANSAANVDKAVAEKPDDAAVLMAAASYNVSKGRNLDQSLTWIDKSIAKQETYRNLYVKSQILAKMGKYAEAAPLAQKALSVGQASNDQIFPFFKDAIQKSITEYTSKVPAAVPDVKAGKGKKKA
ncbi:DUF2911 domain-containing protein [Spirosoma sp. BT702]|uniref:DUF2911 domain-containing protein n=1 Tax=Spirosoma profusum TaxID=2771354 RepID=A0A926Y041_9BACT|nr:DUF2911 domain-containing protein [Spirosoma profusum]MBD2703480.1 DUF2911 domain-containing protein [Spirosoma profusum]